MAIICLILVISTLIWKKVIETRLIQAEKELFKQLSDDSYRPGWHKIPMVTRPSSTNEPPPYEH